MIFLCSYQFKVLSSPSCPPFQLLSKLRFPSTSPPLSSFHTPVLPWLLSSGQRKVRHREKLLSASPWQLWVIQVEVSKNGLSFFLFFYPLSFCLISPLPSSYSGSLYSFFFLFFSAAFHFLCPLCQLSIGFYLLPLSFTRIWFLCDANHEKN